MTIRFDPNLEQQIGLQSLASTIGNEQWMRANRANLQSIFNEDWTKMDQQALLQLMFQLKLKGVQWTHESQIPKIMTFFQRVGICEHKSMPGGVLWVRRTPSAAAAPPPAPPPPPPIEQNRVAEFMAKLARNRKNG